MSAQRGNKIDNSYESEPSSGSGSYLSEQPDYHLVYDESMKLPYILKPPSFETEVVIAAEDEFSVFNQEKNITLATVMSNVQEKSPSHFAFDIPINQEPLLKGFSDSPYGKLQRQFFAKSPSEVLQLPHQSKNAEPSTAAENMFPSNGRTVFARFYDMIVDDNSSNAVDIKLSNADRISVPCEVYTHESGLDYIVSNSNTSTTFETVASSRNSGPSNHLVDLSFNGKINSLTPPSNIDKIGKELCKKHINESFILKKYSNEKSPDIFDDGEDEDEGDKDSYKDDADNENYLIAKELIAVVDSTINPATSAVSKIVNEAKPEPSSVFSLQPNNSNMCAKHDADHADTSVNKSLYSHTESSFADEQSCDLQAEPKRKRSINDSSHFRENCQREKELLRRIRKCLAGVPPPPSVTIPQLDMFTTILSRKQEILDFISDIDTTSQRTCQSMPTFASLFKPTHPMDEVKEMGWQQLLGVRQHGFCFNLCKASESNEYLGLSVIDRFVGSETASSYRNSPSSTKKRNARMKLLTQSPGNRLSHLARRRATFSSAQLATHRPNSLRGPQILVDIKKKNKHRRKNTPKRMTPGSKKKTRKTPSSSARKRLYRCELIKPGPSRETSKRALFQSPPKQLEQRPSVRRLMPSIKPEIANRVEKSKRALFSPDKRSPSSSVSVISNYTLGCDTMLKRKRSAVDDDDTGDSADLPSQSAKLFRGGAENLTPHALKIKSQSFCIGAGSSSAASSTGMTTFVAIPGHDSTSHKNGDLNSQRFSDINNFSSGCKIQRARSDMVAQTNSLTENQRKKLLWAVSQALQEKKITTKHESFKQHAAILARVVRRIFQEYFQKSSSSNSETMLRLAKGYVHNVIAGRGADDIYLQAKSKIEREKNETSFRLSGYIGPEEYQRRKDSQHLLVQTEQIIAQTKNATHSGSISSTLSIAPTFVSAGGTIGQETTASCNAGISLQSQLIGNTLQPTLFKKLPIQTNISLQNSSSKNNMCGLALRENVNFECDQRRSVQKNFTGKDQRNVSPYAHNPSNISIQGASVGKVQTQNITSELNSLHSVTTKVKRQISFDI